MYLLLSGEGVTDMGAGIGVGPVCEGDEFIAGPMALIADQIVESKLEYSVLEIGSCGFVSEHHLAQRAQELKAVKKAARLPGKKQPRETRYFFNNARVLARIAKEKEAQRDDPVVAVLFRDSDAATSAGRGIWSDKRQSMFAGFEAEGFGRGVPMLPRPTSEAWVLCALKPNPYRGCEALEERTANPRSPHGLKKELAGILGDADRGETLCAMVRNRKIDIDRIKMPSFSAFRDRLEEVV